MIHKHITNHITKPDLRSDNTLHVVGVVSNYVRYHSRYRIAREWIEHMESSKNVKLHLVETAYGDRQYELTQASNPNHLQLRTKSEIWIKESMINLAVKHLLPLDWKYMAWIDMDVFFRSHDNWALESIQQLQHFHVIQPWQSAINLGPHGNVMETFESVGRKIRTGDNQGKKYNGDPYCFGHTGYAWCCTRYFWENIRELIWWAILGSSDHHMALGMRGFIENSVHRHMPGSFMGKCIEWQKRAFRVTNGVIGYTPGRIEHHFHGPMKRRYYKTRWNILVDHGFDPDKDLMFDSQGLPVLCAKPHLEHAIKMYNRSRLEDSIEEY